MSQETRNLIHRAIDLLNQALKSEGTVTLGQDAAMPDYELGGEIWPIGKHAGKEFRQLPKAYMTWVVENMEVRRPGDAVDKLKQFVGVPDSTAKQSREPRSVDEQDDLPF